MLRRGDFSVRLPEDVSGLDSEIATLFNEVVGLNEQMTKEFERLSVVVGKEGKIGQRARVRGARRSEEHTSELQSLMRNSYAVFCLKNKNKHKQTHIRHRR